MKITEAFVSGTRVETTTATGSCPAIEIVVAPEPARPLRYVDDALHVRQTDRRAHFLQMVQ